MYRGNHEIATIAVLFDYAGRNGIAAAAILWSPVTGSVINMGTAG